MSSEVRISQVYKGAWETLISLSVLRSAQAASSFSAELILIWPWLRLRLRLRCWHQLWPGRGGGGGGGRDSALCLVGPDDASWSGLALSWSWIASDRGSRRGRVGSSG